VPRQSPADLILQKLRARLAAKASHESPGSPEHYRIQEMLAMSDEALLDTMFNVVDQNPDRIGCPRREALHELAIPTAPAQ